MEPEFKEGEVIIIEPSVVVQDGCYVIAEHDDEYIFRQLKIEQERWLLRPLNDVYPVIEIDGIQSIRGRIISKSTGRGRQCKTYL